MGARPEWTFWQGITGNPHTIPTSIGQCFCLVVAPIMTSCVVPIRMQIKRLGEYGGESISFTLNDEAGKFTFDATSFALALSQDFSS